MAQYATIAKDEQENFVASFWQMLSECETRADYENDPVLKHFVNQWYQQWNRVTNDNKQPIWQLHTR